jgi:hypothetical protein
VSELVVRGVSQGRKYRPPHVVSTRSCQEGFEVFFLLTLSLISRVATTNNTDVHALTRECEVFISIASVEGPGTRRFDGLLFSWLRTSGPFLLPLMVFDVKRGKRFLREVTCAGSLLQKPILPAPKRTFLKPVSIRQRNRGNAS